MLTDYLDDEIGEKEKTRIEEHLKSCQKCMEFSINAKKVGNGLFSGADRANVPEYLWPIGSGAKVLLNSRCINPGNLLDKSVSPCQTE